MIFLNYKHIDDFFQIEENFVRSTDDINCNDATISVRARSCVCPAKNLQIQARIVLQTETLEVFINYDTGKQRFEKIPFKEVQLIRNVRLFAEPTEGSPNKHADGSPDKHADTASHADTSQPHGSPYADTASHKYADAAQPHSSVLLLDKAFPHVPNGAVLNVSHNATRHPVYSEPLQGVALPLWHIGGTWHENGNEHDIESVFIFPSVNANAPRGADINRVRFSELSTYPNVALFPQTPEPWSLKRAAENGDIKWRVEGHALRSTRIEIVSKERAVVTFADSE
ncbi:MAG: hypothetical protein LBR89_02155 [Holosporales bacterium]|jgi:hypothetical protein|nr:hypothetical protein [Holosporales bacterium]